MESTSCLEELLIFLKWIVITIIYVNIGCHCYDLKKFFDKGYHSELTNVIIIVWFVSELITSLILLVVVFNVHTRLSILFILIGFLLIIFNLLFSHEYSSKRSEIMEFIELASVTIFMIITCIVKGI